MSRQQTRRSGQKHPTCTPSFQTSGAPSPPPAQGLHRNHKLEIQTAAFSKIPNVSKNHVPQSLPQCVHAKTTAPASPDGQELTWGTCLTAPAASVRGVLLTTGEDPTSPWVGAHTTSVCSPAATEGEGKPERPPRPCVRSEST